MVFYVYILYSASIDTFYVGHTSQSIPERIRKHLSSHKGFTSKAKDWRLYYHEEFDSKSLAYRREMEIKRKKSRKYIIELKFPVQ